MRNKLRYNKEEIEENLYTKGKEYMQINNTEYIGLYHKYSDGSVFTEGSYIPKISRRLIPFKTKNSVHDYKSKSKLVIRKKLLFPEKPNMLIELINNNQITRYFAISFNKRAFEISKKQYNLWQNGQVDVNLYECVQFNWVVSGPIEDYFRNNVKVNGALSANTKMTEMQISKHKELRSIIGDPLEFYIDTVYNTPKDIN